MKTTRIIGVLLAALFLLGVAGFAIPTYGQVALVRSNVTVTNATSSPVNVDIVSSTVSFNASTTLVTSTSSPLYVSLATALEGEDFINNRLDVAEVFTYTYIKTGTATLIKTGPGLLHTITVSNPSNIASTTVNVYDNTAGSGTQLAQLVIPPSTNPVTMTFDAAYSTGLDVQQTGATSTITVSAY